MNILVVDDEAVQIETISRGLKSRGYRVTPALNADEALEKLKAQSDKIDMVITDYAMPGMNGLGLLKEIRNTHQSLPVIMMTAYGEKDLVINALRNRCDSFIEKPFTLDQLLEETKRVMAQTLQKNSADSKSDNLPRHMHQINNPLMSIVGSAELAMLRLDDSESVKKAMQRILNAADKITRINKEIMKAGLIEADRVEKVDVNALIEDCLQVFEDLMRLKRIARKTDFDHPRSWVAGSRFSLEQVFKNLVLNAIEAMADSAEKVLKIETRPEPDGNTLVVRLTDSGCGIPQEALGSLFTPYFTSKRHGTGLGLSVVKNIVKKHKGTITVNSRPGTGTTFTVTLPAVAAD